MGFISSESHDNNGLILFVLYDNQRVPLEVTLTEYLQLGAELLFMNEWQLALLNDKKYATHGNNLRDMKGRLAKLGTD